MDNIKLYNGDCLDVMDKLIEEGVKVDCIISDIPQGITQNEWDNIIPFDKMWDRLNIIKRNKNVPIILFTNQPFTTRLTASNIKNFKVMKYWMKDRPSGFLNAKRMPLKDMEEIAVFSEESNDIILSEIAIFYEKQPIYTPQFWEGEPLHGMGNKFKSTKHQNNNYNTFDSQNNPSALREGDTKKYPRQVLYYKRPHPPIHPTEKPIELLEDLINTYSKNNDIVLDFTMGKSGASGIACINTNRKFIGIEMDKEYFQFAENRIMEATTNE